MIEQRDGLGREERAVGRDVEETATRAKELEDTLYSGTVKVARELETLQEEARGIREKQSGIEERQMELLKGGVQDLAEGQKREPIDLELDSFEERFQASLAD